MSCNTETKVIDEHECSVTQWPATKAMLIKLKLIKTFGASLALIAGQSLSKDDDDNSSKADAMAMSNGLAALFNNNSPDEILTLIKECVVGVAYDGTKITDSSFDVLFSGDELLQVYKIFIFVLKVNYSNLMKGQLAENFLAKMQENL